MRIVEYGGVASVYQAEWSEVLEVEHLTKGAA